MSRSITLRPHLLALAIASSSLSYADVITWAAVQDSTAATDVSLNGTLVTARNPWSGTSSSPIVNGVTFAAFAPSGWTNGGTPLLNGSTTGDAGYDALLNRARATSEATVSNPTPWGGVEADPNNTFGAGDTVFGQFCIGSFQRTSTDPLYLLVQGTHPLPAVTLRPHFNGFQIREVPPPPIGTNYCAAALNSTGVAAVMSGMGSNVVASNDLTLVASALPLNTFAFFIASTTPDFVMMPGGSAGNLCLGGAIGHGVGGAIVNSGATGTASVLADLQQMPTPTGPIAIGAGETWYFQRWFRDAVGGVATSNFSDTFRVTFN